MTLSLRGRLLIGTVSLVAAGLLVAAVGTYAFLQNFMVGRVDDLLRGGHDQAVAAEGGFGPPSRQTQLPVGTVVELADAQGVVVPGSQRVSTPVGGSPSTVTPKLPGSFSAGVPDQPMDPFTVSGSDGTTRFRMTYWLEGHGSLAGKFIVLAIPLGEVESVLRQLLLLEGLIGLGVLVGTAILGFVIIQVGLRPLQRMGAVAGEIAAGDYSRRVEPATQKTEIGRLGLALNAMLTQIEAAFAQRTASERRLRRFIADASHELRTPLTSIRGYSEMLRRGASESPTDAELARRRIEAESVRMSALVEDMLLIARLDQGRPLESRPVDLQVIARDAAADARAVAPQRDISVDAPNQVMVAGDDTRLRQVVGNLVRNALVHTPTAAPVEIAVTSHNGTAQLSVADHGPGLPPGERERIFEPFYRADASRSRDSGGAGLGLSIVSAVVAAHGGRVSVRETDGGGATFDVELPLAR